MGEYSQAEKIPQSAHCPPPNDVPDSLHTRSELAELTLKYSPSRVAVSTALSKSGYNDRHRRGGQVWRFTIYGYKRITAFPQRRAGPKSARSLVTVQDLRLVETYS